KLALRPRPARVRPGRDKYGGETLRRKPAPQAVHPLGPRSTGQYGRVATKLHRPPKPACRRRRRATSRQTSAVAAPRKAWRDLVRRGRKAGRNRRDLIVSLKPVAAK